MAVFKHRRGISRRSFLISVGTAAGIMASACGSSAISGLDESRTLTDVQRRLLGDKDEIATASSQPTQVAQPTKPLMVHPISSSFGPRTSHYRGVIQTAGSVNEIAPRLEMARFRPTIENRTVGQTIALLADTDPTDLLVFPADSLQDLNDNDLLTPLDKISDIGEAIKPENYWSNTLLDAGRINGRQVAIPLLLGPWLLMYKRKQLSDHGIRDPNQWPWDPTQFAENASRLTQVSGRDDATDRFGFLQIVSENAAIQPIPPSWVWMIAMGSTLPERDGNEEALADEPAVAGLKLMDDLINRHRSVFKVSGSTSGRRLRGLMQDSRISMMSFPVNSGWFLSGWRNSTSEGFDLATLPGGTRRKTPTEIHMMAAVSTWTKHPDAAVTALANLYRTAGQTVFPSAIRAQIDHIPIIEPVMRESDIRILESGLQRSQPIIFSKPEKRLLIQRLDRAITFDKSPPEEAANDAARALSEFRLAASIRSGSGPAAPAAIPGSS